MTFCRGDGCKAFDACPRAITEKVEADARRWWGGDDYPIAQWENPKALKCYEHPTEDKP
jgi:hypothetical protein